MTKIIIRYNWDTEEWRFIDANNLGSPDFRPLLITDEEAIIAQQQNPGTSEYWCQQWR